MTINGVLDFLSFVIWKSFFKNKAFILFVLYRLTYNIFISATRCWYFL